jgi:bacterioferritin
MHGDPEVLDLLNEVLTAELTAINQYFLDAKMLNNWGFERLGRRFRDDSIDEMKDADRLIDRILYLEGYPNLQRLGNLRVGETPREKLELTATLEREAVDRLNRGVARCVAQGDNGTRELLAHILVGEEEHLDWVETQLDAMTRLGEVTYLAEQLHHDS